MPAASTKAVFHQHVYRDFLLITLAALGVGLLFSLSLATAIVLANPGREVSSSRAPAMHTAIALRAGLAAGSARAQA